MQHIQIKLFAESAAGIRIEDAIPVFHRWIQTSALPGLFIDVADYAHVPAGPGVMLIGHEANVSLDESGSRLGLLYDRKAPLDGDAQSNLKAAYEFALAAASKLEGEPEFRSRLRFRRDTLQIILNDRLLYPNNEETWEKCRPDLMAFVDRVLGPGKHVERAADPRARFSVEFRGQST
jgi:hypothetical protein